MRAATPHDAGGCRRHPTGAILDRSPSPWGFLLLVNAVFLIGGSFLNATALLIILVPIFLPMAERFGIDLVHLSSARRARRFGALLRW